MTDWIQWTVGVIEYHDLGYMFHEKKQNRPYKYATPATINRIKQIPNRTPLYEQTL